MLGGFDPRLQEMFVRRNRGGALVWGVLVLGLVGGGAWLAYPPKQEAEAIVEVQLEPQIEDFAVEEEEPEIEEEPPPPPPPDTKLEIVDKPKPKRKLQPPDKKVDQAAEESEQNKTVQVGAGAGTAGGSGAGTSKAPPKSVQPKPKPEPKPEPKPKPKPKAKPKLDPTQPVDRPENATAPKPSPGNASPVYPKELRDKGITGKVVIKLHVHRDGTVRGAKILRKSNNATTDEDKERANKLFLSAVVKAVKSWTFTPAKLAGQPITVWHTVTIPFTLTAG
ncbi:MAG: TonB family protein [Myxococcales bacterium]|nr:TonB family protein [Myxococcales bacterium]